MFGEPNIIIEPLCDVSWTSRMSRRLFRLTLSTWAVGPSHQFLTLIVSLRWCVKSCFCTSSLTGANWLSPSGETSEILINVTVVADDWLPDQPNDTVFSIACPQCVGLWRSMNCLPAEATAAAVTADGHLLSPWSCRPYIKWKMQMDGTMCVVSRDARRPIHELQSIDFPMRWGFATECRCDVILTHSFRPERQHVGCYGEFLTGVVNLVKSSRRKCAWFTSELVFARDANEKGNRSLDAWD